jgi:hypothetical protein
VKTGFGAALGTDLSQLQVRACENKLWLLQAAELFVMLTGLQVQLQLLVSGPAVLGCHPSCVN